MGPGDPSPTCVASDSIRLACTGSAGEALTTKTLKLKFCSALTLAVFSFALLKQKYCLGPEVLITLFRVCFSYA